jgi:hypothetical protein
MTTNSKRFARNIEPKGRWLRGIAAGALLLGGLAAWFYSLSLSLGLLVSGAFVLFEALRGWCALRACGIKTKF